MELQGLDESRSASAAAGLDDDEAPEGRGGDAAVNEEAAGVGGE